MARTFHIPGDTLPKDYFRSLDCERGLPWIFIDEGLWAILLPQIPPSKPRRVVARPVVDQDEPDGWRWRIELDQWTLPVPAQCMTPTRAELPPSGGRYIRFCSLITSWVDEHQLGPYLFGHLKAGLQIYHECPLIITRPPRRQLPDQVE